MENYTKIAAIENEFEAQILKVELEERKIPHYLKSFYDAAYDGLYQKSLGWGIVLAPPNYTEEIVEIIRDIRRELNN